MSDAQPGYYDAGGRWRQGQTTGYYDGQGRWHATGANAGVPRDLASQEARIEQRIRQAGSDGRLGNRDTKAALKELQSIRQRETRLRQGQYQLSAQDTGDIQARLDRLNDKVAMALRDTRPGY